MSKQFMFLRSFFCKKIDLYFIHNCKLILNVTCEPLRQKNVELLSCLLIFRVTLSFAHPAMPAILFLTLYRHRFRKIIIGIIDIVIALCRIGKG
jgi:hypothetical protein